MSVHVVATQWTDFVNKLDEQLPHEAREVWKPNSQQKAAINKEKKLKKKIYKKKLVEKKGKSLTTNDATTSKLRNNRVVEMTQNAVPELKFFNFSFSHYCRWIGTWTNGSLWHTGFKRELFKNVI